MMKLGKIFWTAAALSAVCCAGIQTAGPAGAGEKQKGISYACWSPGLYSLPESEISLGHLAETGANWIGLIVTCYQDNLGSTRISANESTPTDDDLIHALTQAHGLGLKVMLKPHLDLWRDPSHWRGQIGSAFRTEAEWSEWFSSYRAFIEHYADLAHAQGADQFCVGTELEGTSHRAADWRNVVAGVRARYSGPLIYAANHSGEEAGITWWDAVDLIGVDAYYPLTSKTNPSVAELKAAWRPRIMALAGLAAKWQKPVILTEIGYRSQDGANMHPWDWQIRGTIDLQEQADCYTATFESFYNQPWFGGVFWWSWGPDPLEGGPNDDNYTPHDKPAEDVLRAWFGGRGRREIRANLEPDRARRLEILADGLGPGWEDRSWDATLDFSATDQVRRGRTSLRARLGARGALSFWHPAMVSYPYYFLEFSIRGSADGEPQLWAYFHDRDDNPLFKLAVNDPRYLKGGTVEAGRWKTVTIPLYDMGAVGRRLSRVSLQDRSGRGTSDFWVDDLWLVGAKRETEKAKPSKKINGS